MSVGAVVLSEFVSAGLALILIYLFSRAYRLTRYVHLLGLPIGFSFLAFSYVFLGMSLLYESDVAVSGQFQWLGLVTQTFGFAFIAFAYYFSSKGARSTRYFLGIISFVSVISVILVLAALTVAPPFLELPSPSVVDECVRVVNIFFLGYVIYHVIKSWESSQAPASRLIWTPMAFSFLWLGQYSLLICGIDGGQTAFILAHVFRLASLVLFLRIYCLSGEKMVET